MPKGDTLVTAGSDGILKFWELPGFRLKSEAPTLPKGLSVLACSRDGRTLATGDGKHVAVYDAGTGKQQYTFEVQHLMPVNRAPAVSGLAFSPDGATLAVGVWCSNGPIFNGVIVKGEIHFCDIATQKEVQVVQAHPNGVRCLAFSPDGQSFATGGANQAILWDAAKRQERFTLEGHTEDIFALAFAPDGATLATASADRTIRLWDTATGKLRRVLEEHVGQVRSLSFSPDGKFLALGAAIDNAVLLWNLETGKAQVALARRQRGISIDVVSFSPDGKLLAVTRKGGQSIKFMDPAKIQNRPPENLCSKTGSPDDIGVLRVDAESLWFTPDGKTLMTFGRGGDLKLWDVPGFTLRATKSGHAGAPRAVSHSLDGRKLAVTAGSFVYLRNGATGDLERTLTTTYSSAKQKVNGIWPVALAPKRETRRWRLACAILPMGTEAKCNFGTRRGIGPAP